MHYVPKGKEPAGLASVRAKCTPRWVDYYKHHLGKEPKDSHWRRFAEALGDEFHDLCGYCERECKGEVEHFRPKKRYPHKVYRWDNWVFACPACNRAKGEKWPKTGYIFPCEPTAGKRLEDYFTFDTMTGEILPRSDLNKAETGKAWQMIVDLNLRGSHHLKSRLRWLDVVKTFVEATQEDKRNPFFEKVTSRRYPHSSIVRLYLREQRLFDPDSSPTPSALGED